MLKHIIQFSIRNKLLIGLFTLGLLGYGIFEVTKLPIDAVPDITDNQVQIITTSPALGAPDVERFITFPVEQANANIQGIKQIRSFSRFGLSVVTIVFEDNIDVYWARQQVAERLQQIQQTIPAELGIPTMAPITTGLGEIYQYVVRPEKGYEQQYSLADLRTIQDWIVRRQLLGVAGVADVASFGGHLKQYEVAVNPARLAANEVTIQDVFNALEHNNQNTGGAYIEKGPTVLFIRSEGLVGSTTDIQNIVVKNLSNGTPVLIKDIAEVKIGEATRYGAMSYNGEREVAGAVVMMLKGANSSGVIKSVKERIEQIKKTLPPGVTIDPFLDRTKMVNNAIGTVSKNLIEGALIVIFVLVLFLGNLRAGLLVSSVIPLSMLFAVIMMNTFGVSGNLMSLGALDFGLIVDGAVIIVEAVLHKLVQSNYVGSTQSISQQRMDEEVNQSASKMMSSAVFGQLIILIVYLPILSLHGIEGKMFKPMAQTVAFALIGAFILSLTYVPVMSTLFLSKKINHQKNFSDKMMDKLIHVYQITLTKALAHSKVIMLTTVGVFIAAMLLFTSLGGEFIPSLPEGDFAVDTRVLPGSNLTTSVDRVLKAEKLLLSKFPEIEKIVGKTGSSEIPTDPMPIEASDMMIILKDRDEWVSATNYDDLAALMTEALKEIPGVTFSFQYPVAMRFNELMTGARQDVVCKIFGENLDTLAKYAQRLGEICTKTEGSSNIYVEPVSGMPQIVIRYNRDAISKYGLSVDAINNTVNTAFAGKATGMVYEGEKRFDLVVRLGKEQREDLRNVEELLINTPQGAQIPLSALATVAIENGVNQIQRENAQRRIIVGFNVRERDVESTVHDLQDQVNVSLQLPPGYFITYGGAFENLKEAKSRLSIAVPVSLLLIFFLLYFAFHSVKYGLLIYTAIPLSAIGGVFALAARGMPFSISAGVGFIALFGVAVLNGIVLIAEFNRKREEGMNDLHEVVIKAGMERLRPVLMTACVASFGFLPMALSQGEGAEVQRPLATVVIGGLLLATLLTLYVLPVLYVWFEQASKPKAKTLLLLLPFLLPFKSEAQQPISLQAAVDSTIKNAFVVRTAELSAELALQQSKTAWNMPQTVVGYEQGNINSSFTDNRFFVSQNMQFPLVYVRQKQTAIANWQVKKAEQKIQTKEMIKEIKSLFFQLLVLQQKEKLLLESDSLYASYLEKVTLRIKNGEAALAEKINAESLKAGIAIQLAQLRADQNNLRLQFNWLMNTQETYQPDAAQFKMKDLTQSEIHTISNHPLLLKAEQEKVYQSQLLKLERSKLLPELSFAYYDMSMIGLGADDVFYADRFSRFRSVQFSLGIPLFYRASKYGIKSQQTAVKIADLQLRAKSLQLNLQYNQLMAKYNTHKSAISYFESIGLNNANTLRKVATQQFYQGDINYLEWTMLNHQAVQMQTQYLDELQQYNQTLIELESLQQP
ncbi:MAG: CusA/CzcA family heavy metal efflux RND transporter [Bacteroidota bacterium]